MIVVKMSTLYYININGILITDTFDRRNKLYHITISFFNDVYLLRQFKYSTQKITMEWYIFLDMIKNDVEKNYDCILYHIKRNKLLMDEICTILTTIHTAATA